MIVEFSMKEAEIVKEAIDRLTESYDIADGYKFSASVAKSKITRAIAHTLKKERVA